MTIVLEKSGGFVGRMAPQVVEVDLDSLPKEQAHEIKTLYEAVPPKAWGGSFLSAHPKSWDFKHVLKVRDDGAERRVEYHQNEGPPELMRLGEKVLERAKK
ncbi:MAG TPA: protealysin inhibitor emfourin [Verrucomicrobiae bacterium]|nr:protealysin inhibitor emfourin [Verrucomicrobiae bacterium]